MKFSENRYYLEAYIKCDNCGVLLYDSDSDKIIQVDKHRFCSNWCLQWHDSRKQHVSLERKDK
jgi:N-methylhydantoinase B